MNSDDITRSPTFTMVSRESGMATDLGIRPRKSILKLRDGNTMPLIPLNDTNGHTPGKIVNRRVSFAEKVKLHQIELVQAPEPEWAESDLLESDVSSDEDSSFLKLEADADKIAQALGQLLVPQQSSDDEDVPNAATDDEQTMELTGQISKLVDERADQDEQTMELTGQISELASELFKHEKQNGDSHSQNGDEIALPKTKPVPQPDTNLLDLGEAEMELTEYTNGSVLNSADGAASAESAKDVPDDRSDGSFGDGLSSSNSLFDADPAETEPALPLTFADRALELKSSSPIQIPVLQPLTDEEESELENDADVPMELTQQVNGEQENISDSTPLPVASQEAAENGEEEMELTESVSVPKPDQLLSNGAKTDIEREENPGEASNDDAIGNIQTDLVSTPENQLLLDAPEPSGNGGISETPQNGHQESSKRASPDGETHQHKRLHVLNYVTSTTTIPLAEVSMTSIDGDVDDLGLPVSLNDFLGEIGIKFYDDLQFSTDKSNRYRLSLSDAHDDISPEDYYRANVQLPILEVYELCCKELSGKIEQGKKLFDELKAETLQDNPEIFRQYYRSSFYDQMTLKSRFHTLKEYTRQQAKQIWYQWRSKLVGNILDVLKNNLEMMQSDKAVLIDQIAALDSISGEIQQKYHSIRLEVLHFKDIQSKFQNLDAEQIKNIKQKLTQLNQQLIDHKSQITSKEQKLQSLQQEISKRSEEINALKEKITHADHKLGHTRPFNSAEIGALEVKSQILQAGAGLKYVEVVDEDRYKFQFNSKINVAVDFSRVNESNGITLLPIDDSGTEILHNEKFLLRYCQQLVEQTSFTNIFESFVSFRRKWLKITEIDQDIHQLAVRYPIHYEEQVSDAIAFTFAYYSFETREKARCKVQIPLESILEYPKNVQFEVVPQKQSPQKIAEARRHIVSGFQVFHMFRAQVETP